jgi:ankyrin repeat protein
MDADVSISNNLGITPLHVAAQRGTTICVKLLLRYDANVNSIDIEKNDPLTFSHARRSNTY